MPQGWYLKLSGFMDAVGLLEEPMGLFYTDVRPDAGFTPKPIPLPTREQEKANTVDWQKTFGSFSCAMGHIWRARRKHTAAYFSKEHFGCLGAAFWLGFNKPQLEAIIHYVSTGVPNMSHGEHYLCSPDAVRNAFNHVDPEPATADYLVVKPLSLFTDNETPLLVTTFARPECLCGLHQLAAYVTSDPEVVASPWTAGCGGICAWPLHYLARGMQKAVISGWDPSARKFYKTDELTFTVPHAMFLDMLEQYEKSFLSTNTWKTVRKKIDRSHKAWNEDKA